MCSVAFCADQSLRIQLYRLCKSWSVEAVSGFLPDICLAKLLLSPFFISNVGNKSVKLHPMTTPKTIRLLLIALACVSMGELSLSCSTVEKTQYGLIGGTVDLKRLSLEERKFYEENVDRFRREEWADW